MSEPGPASMWTTFYVALVRGERWDEFVRLYGPVIRGWGAKYRPLSADDLVQEVYVRLFKALPRYDKSQGPFRGWLFTITRNLAMDLLKKAVARPGLLATGDSDVRAMLEQVADDLATGISGLADSRLQALAELEARCEPRTWQMVVAFHAGKSAREVAAEFGATLGAVHQAVYRVRKLAEEVRSGS